ncbi:amino acid ABC transporter ATP-binding protein [Treponema sp.]|uniref:amino acid ABC transporter ATP-binding protein n=1 Tax=Treponema sp. TaxID=166 RepID=UPI003F00FF4B
MAHTESRAMIDMQHITMRYGELTVLDDISLEISEGSKTCIIGPSGAGKSTLLRCMNLFEKPYSGTVTVNGQELTGQKSKVLYKARQEIGMVFQSFNLYTHKTVLENLTFAPILLKHENKDEVIDRAMENLEKVGLSSKMNSYPSQLSGGQQQRVAIARALTMRPKVILFDEPTSALDPEMISEVLKIMEDVARENITMVFVTHEMGFARHIADRLLFLEGGHIMEDGTPEDVIENPKNERTKQFFSKILKSN